MKTARTVLTIGVTLATLALGGVAALAQMGYGPQSSGPTGQSAMKQGGGRMAQNDPGQRLEQMTRRLNLTTEQQEKIKPILAEEATQAKAIDEAKLTRDERRDKMQELRTATFEKIQPILTPEQQKKHEALRQRMHERRSKGVGGQPAPTVGPK